MNKKRKYQKSEPVSLRPLDLKTALAGLLGFKPGVEEKEGGREERGDRGEPEDREDE